MLQEHERISSVNIELKVCNRDTHQNTLSLFFLGQVVSRDQKRMSSSLLSIKGAVLENMVHI